MKISPVILLLIVAVAFDRIGVLGRKSGKSSRKKSHGALNTIRNIHKISTGSWYSHYTGSHRPRGTSLKQLEKVGAVIYIDRSGHKANGTRYSYHGHRQTWHYNNPDGVIGIGRSYQFEGNSNLFETDEDGFLRLNSRPVLKCYVCRGKDTDDCGRNVSAIKQFTCNPGDLCAVIKYEYPKSYQIPFECKYNYPEGSKYRPFEENYCIKEHNMKYNPAGTTQIQRFCIIPRAMMIFRNTNLEGLAENRRFKEYLTVCNSDFCNTDDAALRCYECEGTGEDDPCMINPAAASKIITCSYNQVCYVRRAVVKLNDTNSLDVSDDQVILGMSIVRGCRALSSEDEDFEVDEGGDILSGIATFTCASHLCNTINGHSFSQMVVDSVPGLTASMTTVLTLVLVPYYL